MNTHSLQTPALGLGCIFQLQKFKADGTITYTGPKFHNVVLGVGYDLMLTHGPHGQSNGGANYCNLGSGAQFEDKADDELKDYVIGTDNVISSETYYSSGVDYDYPAWRSWRQIFEFEIGSISHDVSEIGLSRDLNEDYFNRHRIVDLRGNHIGLDILPDEGLKVWAETYLFGSADVADVISGEFEFQGSSGTVTIGYTWEQLDGWLTASGIIPGGLYPDDVRILDSVTYDPSDGTPASSVSSSCASGSGNNYATAKWNAGVLSGEYTTLLVNMGGATYGRFDLDTPIVMDNEETSLKITILRDLSTTLEEAIWR